MFASFPNNSDWANISKSTSSPGCLQFPLQMLFCFRGWILLPTSEQQLGWVNQGSILSLNVVDASILLCSLWSEENMVLVIPVKRQYFLNLKNFNWPLCLDFVGDLANKQAVPEALFLSIVITLIYHAFTTVKQTVTVWQMSSQVYLLLPIVDLLVNGINPSISWVGHMNNTSCPTNIVKLAAW